MTHYIHSSADNSEIEVSVVPRTHGYGQGGRLASNGPYVHVEAEVYDGTGYCGGIVQPTPAEARQWARALDAAAAEAEGVPSREAAREAVIAAARSLLAGVIHSHGRYPYLQPAQTFDDGLELPAYYNPAGLMVEGEEVAALAAAMQALDEAAG